MGSRWPEKKRMSRWTSPWGARMTSVSHLSDSVFSFLLGQRQWFVRFVIGDSCRSGPTSSKTSTEGCLLSEDAWMHQ